MAKIRIALYIVIGASALTILLLAALVYYLPDLASNRRVQTWLLETYGQTEQRIFFERAEFSWKGPQRIGNFTYSANGNEITVSSIEVHAGLREILYRVWHREELTFPHRVIIADVHYRNADMDLALDIRKAELDEPVGSLQPLTINGRLTTKGVVLPLLVSGNLDAVNKTFALELDVPKIPTKLVATFLNAQEQMKLITDVIGHHLNFNAKVQGNAANADIALHIVSPQIRVHGKGNMTGTTLSFSIDGDPLKMNGALTFEGGSIRLKETLLATLSISSRTLETVQSRVDETNAFELTGPLVVQVQAHELAVSDRTLALLDIKGSLSGLGVTKNEEGTARTLHQFEPITFTVDKKSPTDNLLIAVNTSVVKEGTSHVSVSVLGQTIAVNLNEFPTAFINRLINVFGASRVVEDILGSKFDAQFERTKSGYGLQIKAAHLKTKFELVESDQAITLRNDMTVLVKPTGVIDDYLLVSINPLLSSGIVSERDAKLSIDAQGFLIGKPVRKESIQIDHGSLDLGLVHTLNRGALANVLKELKLAGAFDVEETPVFFGTINFSVKNGFVFIKPFTMKVGDKKPITVSGITDLTKELSSLKLTYENRTYLVEGPLAQVALTAADRPDRFKGQYNPQMFSMAEKLMPLVSAPYDAEAAKDAKGTWEFRLNLGGSLSFNKQDGVNQGSKLFFGGFLGATLEYTFFKHIWSNQLALHQTFTTHPTRRNLIVKSNDSLLMNSIYLYLLQRNIGFFGEIRLITSILPGFEYPREDYRYVDENGQPWPIGDRVRISLSDSFSPLIVQENAGAIVRPIIRSSFLLENRLGLSLRESFAKGQLAIDDVNTKEKTIVIKNLENTVEAGPFVGISASGVLLFRRLSYRLSSDAMWPLFTSSKKAESAGFFESINTNTAAALNLSILEWIAIEAQSGLLRFPHLSKLWQFHASIFFLFSYTF